MEGDGRDGQSEKEEEGGRDTHVWLPDLCDGERERGREREIGKSEGTTHWAPDGISSSCLCCGSNGSELILAVSGENECKVLHIQTAQTCTERGQKCVFKSMSKTHRSSKKSPFVKLQKAWCEAHLERKGKAEELQIKWRKNQIRSDCSASSGSNLIDWNLIICPSLSKWPVYRRHPYQISLFFVWWAHCWAASLRNKLWMAMKQPEYTKKRREKSIKSLEKHFAFLGTILLLNY